MWMVFANVIMRRDNNALQIVVKRRLFSLFFFLGDFCCNVGDDDVVRTPLCCGIFVVENEQKTIEAEIDCVSL